MEIHPCIMEVSVYQGKVIESRRRIVYFQIRFKRSIHSAMPLLNELFRTRMVKCIVYNTYTCSFLRSFNVIFKNRNRKFLLPYRKRKKFLNFLRNCYGSSMHCNNAFRKGLKNQTFYNIRAYAC